MNFTPVQKEIIDMVMNGMTNTEIAAETGLSTTTVKRRLSELYDMHRVNSRIGLVRKIIMNITGNTNPMKKRFL